MLLDVLLNDEQKAIKEAAREFAEKEIASVAEEYDLKEEFPWDVFKKAVKLGFIGMGIPEEYGGQGLKMLDACLVVEEFFRVDAGVGMILASTFGSEMLMYFGTEEQKQKYLPPLCEGKTICGAAFTEPAAGSDVAGIKMKAIKEGDEYVLNGTKTFITNGTIADWFVVLARTDPNAEKRHQGMSVFIVDANSEGLTRTKIKNKLGIRSSDTAELSFKNVRVPAENLVGQEGNGFMQAMVFFNTTRIPVAFQAVGIAQGAFELAFEYSKNREIFGRKLKDFQLTQDKFAKMRTEIEASRLLAIQAAMQADTGMPDPGLTAMAKYYCAKTAVKVCDEALQIFGGYGYIGEYPISRFYRDAKITELYEGTKEVEKEIISRSLYGKLPSQITVLRKPPY